MNQVLETCRQNCEVRRILSTYLLATGIEMPKGVRTQIGPSSFVRRLTDGEGSQDNCQGNCQDNCQGNLLIIQGGVNHMDNQSYYVRMACILAPTNLRIFLYENLTPIVNLNFAHQISDACEVIRKNFPGPLVIVGYSMGGVMLYNYLSLGYDQADLYLPICCPLDLERFRETIDRHALFRMLQRVNYRKFQVTDYEELLTFAKTSKAEQDKLVQKFIPGLNSHRSWQKKTLYCVSSDDPITQNYQEELKLLKRPPAVFRIKGGWHCCLDTIRLSIQLACLGCRQVRKEGKVTPSELDPRENEFLRQVFIWRKI